MLPKIGPKFRGICTAGGQLYLAHWRHEVSSRSENCRLLRGPPRGWGDGGAGSMEPHRPKGQWGPWVPRRECYRRYQPLCIDSSQTPGPLCGVSCTSELGQTLVLVHGIPWDVLEGGGGGLTGTPLLPGSPYGPRRRRAENFLSVNPLGTKGAEAKFWLPASNIGRGGGGVQGGVPPLVLRCTAVPIHRWASRMAPGHTCAGH